MPIETNNLVLYKSERLADTEDGGGKYSGQVIIDGQSNNLFDDISEMDRTMGDVSMRKIFPAVTTNDTDKLMGATVFISQNPKDPNVSALLFSTKDWNDQRKSAQNRVENYLAKGGQISGIPLDTHWQGMKTIQVCLFTSETECSVGDTIVLVSNEGKALQHEQYVRITKAETRIAKIIIDGKEFEYKLATYSINDPLDIDYVGLSVKQWYNNEKSTTIIRESIVADTGEYCASVSIVDDVNVGEYSIKASSIFAQLVPSAQAETAILDSKAVGEGSAYIAGNNGAITVSAYTLIRPDLKYCLGSGVMPNSLTFNLISQSFKDQNGLLISSSGTSIGTIDYQRGIIQWTVDYSNAGSYSFYINFQPATNSNLSLHSDSILVSQNNQSANWTGVFVPIPAPGTTTISYMSQGKFYDLKDNGNGQLKGSSASIGAGSINYETGTWMITTGALPDVDSSILMYWGTPITTFVRSNLTVESPAFEFNLGQQAIAASSVEIKWLLDGVSKTAKSNASGKFTGDATGTINYAKGTGRIVPSLLPQKGTVFTITYSFGEAKEQQIEHVNPDTSNLIRFTIGTGAALQPNSIELTVPVSDFESQYTGSVVLTDVPLSSDIGNLIDRVGNVQGKINYLTGQVEATPFMDKVVYKRIYTVSEYVIYSASM
ncbi:hypothetical protein [Acinetobacter stercoris]|uniref:Uncharacterized protein n=1 Tax=Acinetobacter stercoris TaxID=2126983 RepID=A0A2U3N225_9GAMM|nr:hypothetical protein [Acinetobacter stercoris]SPL71740.1 hypothetical protein KPC_2918 [Acinetobacter stercoris]